MTRMLPLLQAAANSNAAGSGMSMTLIMILLIIVIFYFFMIRPQQKRQKQVEEFKSGLQKGDKVTTIGGVHGKICEVKETTFVLEIANDVRVEVDKAAIAVDEAQLKKPKKEEK